MNKHPHLIIPIFIPHQGCPHQCVFCNQTTITSVKSLLPSREELHSKINEFLTYKRPHRKTVQVAFYGGNFLGLKKEDIQKLLDETTHFVKSGWVDSIRFSTRPDTIKPSTLDLLKDFPVSTIEIGVQSMDDEVLALCNRGHRAVDTENASHLLKSRHYQVGMQMMLGLPGEHEAQLLDTGQRIADLSPDFVRIYPAVVLKKSRLGQWYRSGKYHPLALDQCVSLVKKLYLLFKENGIPVIRMGLQASQDLEPGVSILAGPYHPAFGHLVYSEIFLDQMLSHLKENSYHSIHIYVHPRNISKARGLNNKNIEILKNKFKGSIQVIPDPLLGDEAVAIKTCEAFKTS